ncbi:Uma2 family endonuclease [Streptomyces sp. NBC_01236]|uniref:Uma2 family endonuclease n=1 Tax=Streptomyces sp. NBC_01236 TaxID=2903789 RepID=UPI002E0D2640|nr:Uma2 family endonuclease [Streptomyces sp. NBC_01236]
MSENEVDPDAAQLDAVLWAAWKAMELPEGYRAEIIEGAIEVQRIGRVRHALIANRLSEALPLSQREDAYAAYQAMAVTLGRRRVWMPDVLVASEGRDPRADAEGIGIAASAVHLVAEVVSRGKRHQDRDRVRKRREYARVGIPVYVIIDDYDDHGTVTVLTEPHPEKADWVGVHRVLYGTEVTIPEGPAKGFVIGEAITGPKRA